MSDLHFDPMADPQLVDRLAASEPSQWRNILDSSGDASLGRYGRDTNWRLLQSALQQMKETLPAPNFVLLSGDFLAHDFRREFDSAAGDHSDAAYRVFVRKTMQFMRSSSKHHFPLHQLFRRSATMTRSAAIISSSREGRFWPTRSPFCGLTWAVLPAPVSTRIGRATETTASR
jgi:hypothetical protein